MGAAVTKFLLMKYFRIERGRIHGLKCGGTVGEAHIGPKFKARRAKSGAGVLGEAAVNPLPTS